MVPLFSVAEWSVKLLIDLHVVDEQAHAVVAGREERVGPRDLRAHLARPAHAEGVGGDAGHGHARAPVEVHGGVEARDDRAREVLVVEVVALQPTPTGTVLAVKVAV
jgi:hypothetical protein